MNPHPLLLMQQVFIVSPCKVNVMANAPKSRQAQVSPKQTALIRRRLINLSQITYIQRYQPLNKPLAELEPEALERLGIAIYNTSQQASFEQIVGPDEQTQYLKDIRDALTSAGLLERFFEMPDGTLLLPHLVQSADYGSMPNGWVVRLYRDGHETERPMMTCLCSNEAECISILTALSERLKGSCVQ